MKHTEWLGRLEAIILRNELYFPTARELEDPAEARPELTPVSNCELINVIVKRSAEQKPYLTQQGHDKDAAIIAYNIPRLGTAEVTGVLRHDLYSKLEKFRIYSLQALG